MRIKRLVIISRLLLSHTTFAAESAEECYRLPSHMEWRECLDDLADKTNALVAGAQDLVRKRISASDEEESFKSKTRALFEFSIQEFEKYKSVQCTYESSAATVARICTLTARSV